MGRTPPSAMSRSSVIAHYDFAMKGPPLAPPIVGAVTVAAGVLGSVGDGAGGVGAGGSVFGR